MSPTGRSAAVASDQWLVASKDQGRKDEIATGLKPLAVTEKGAEGILRQAQDDRPLVHYVFKPENTYETEFRGRKALGVRDLGKGEPADLVIPEYFEPYKRVFLGWDPEWMDYKANWLDLAVNVLGFVPFGMLLIFAAGKKKCLSVLVPECLSEEKEGFGLRASGFGTKGRDKGRRV